MINGQWGHRVVSYNFEESFWHFVFRNVMIKRLSAGKTSDVLMYFALGDLVI